VVVVCGAVCGALLMAGAPPVTNSPFSAHADSPSGGAPSRSVIVIGDSISALNVSTLERYLKQSTVPSWTIAAQTRRRIAPDEPVARHTITSGLNTISSLRQRGFTAQLWIVELGTNDLFAINSCGCSDRRAFALQRIEETIAAIGADQEIAWVTVRHPSFPSAAAYFDDALRRAAAADDHLTLIDWYTLSAGHSSWFVDGIHPSQSGASQLFGLIGRAARALLPAVVVPEATLETPPASSPSIIEDSVLDEATADRPAVRLRTPRPPVGGETIVDRCGRITDDVGFGSPASAVRSVQCALTEAGYDPGPIDGTYNARTQSAIRAFALYQGLSETTVDMAVGHSLGIYDYT